MDPSRSRNALLNHLSTEDFGLLRPHLEHRDLGLRYRLSEANRPIERVYFLESGLASMVANVRHQVPIEIGIVGREGVANVSALMGSDRSPNEAFMQVAGAGLSIDAERAREALWQSRTLWRACMQFAHVYMVQMASNVLTNGRASVTERLARWLLMAHDRLGDDELQLTHEFLSVMLGVRRAGVTVALQDFERRGLTHGGRGMIRILERQGLVTAANGFYGIAEAEFMRIFAADTDPGPPPVR